MHAGLGTRSAGTQVTSTGTARCSTQGRPSLRDAQARPTELEVHAAPAGPASTLLTILLLEAQLDDPERCLASRRSSLCFIALKNCEPRPHCPAMPCPTTPPKRIIVANIESTMSRLVRTLAAHVERPRWGKSNVRSSLRIPAPLAQTGHENAQRWVDRAKKGAALEKVREMP
jgi:hypothetical protein